MDSRPPKKIIWKKSRKKESFSSDGLGIPPGLTLLPGGSIPDVATAAAQKEKKKNFFLGGKERIESRRFILSLSLFLCGDVNGRREKERGDIKRRRVEERDTERRPIEIKTGLTFRRHIRI